MRAVAQGVFVPCGVKVHVITYAAERCKALATRTFAGDVNHVYRLGLQSAQVEAVDIFTTFAREAAILPRAHPARYGYRKYSNSRPLSHLHARIPHLHA